MIVLWSESLLPAFIIHSGDAVAKLSMAMETKVLQLVGAMKVLIRYVSKLGLFHTMAKFFYVDGSGGGTI